MQALFYPYRLNLKFPSGTSRGVLHHKDTYFLILQQDHKLGVGECALFKRLSCDDTADYEQTLHKLSLQINNHETINLTDYKDYPSIVFGYEQAILSLKSDNPFILFDSHFTKSNHGIPINGLIWMGDKDFMKTQIDEKLKSGFSTIKLKIGAIDFETELSLIKYIRNQFSFDKITIRVDANGAFDPKNALDKLDKLAKLNIHSIEQPIKPNQLKQMATLCEKTPLPIALDEELIGINQHKDKKQLLQYIKPQYIILKPALHGGFCGSEEWINLAEKQSIGWWLTSALESNIGLNAIAQFTSNKQAKLPQGLGTGGLFTNNFNCPLFVKNGELQYHKNTLWNTQQILQQIKTI